MEMTKENNSLSLWQSASIITGYGIGGGVMAMPYLAESNGIVSAFLILSVAFVSSIILHLMIAELAIRSGDGQIIGAFSRFLFKGKMKKALTISFFVLMALVLIFNLAAYVEGAAEIISPLTGLSMWASRLLFYFIAAAVVLFGLKAVGISEGASIIVIYALVMVLAAASLFKIKNPLPLKVGNANEALAYFGMAMFAFSAFFSVPQAVEGLNNDRKKIRKAVVLGMANNYIMIILITLSALLSSVTVTEVAMVGWSKGIGAWAEMIGSLFTILAMLTTYWSISLALCDIIREETKIGRKLSWLLSTLPSLFIALLSASSFFSIMRIAGGLIAILIAMMVVPAYRNAKNGEKDTILGPLDGRWTEIIMIVMYILMAVGNVVPV